MQRNFGSAALKPRFPVCPICNEAVELQTSKADEFGRAVHEECYVPKMTLRHSPSQGETAHSPAGAENGSK